MWTISHKTGTDITQSIGMIIELGIKWVTDSAPWLRRQLHSRTSITFRYLMTRFGSCKAQISLNGQLRVSWIDGAARVASHSKRGVNWWRFHRSFVTFSGCQGAFISLLLAPLTFFFVRFRDYFVHKVKLWLESVSWKWTIIGWQTIKHTHRSFKI